MNALILYFSGTGNTEYVAKKIRNLLTSLNVKGELHSIEGSYHMKPNSFDMLILGCPKYYEYPVLDFIQYLKKNLPVNKRTIPTMIFCTQAGPLLTDFKKIEKLLERKNYRLVAEHSFPIANNMVIFDKFPPTSDEKRKENLETLNKELNNLVADFVNGTEIKETPNLFFRVISYLCAIICTRLFKLLAVKYSASEQCTGCGFCAKKCPKNNIIIHNKKPRFGRKCIFCMRCINVCPRHAILYRKKQRVQYHKIKENRRNEL